VASLCGLSISPRPLTIQHSHGGERISALLDDVAVGEWSVTEAASGKLSAEQRGQLVQIVDKNLLICRAIAEIAGEGVRHRMTNGTLPKSLDELDRSPTGLLSGKPLVYNNRAEGFAIYDELPDQGRFEVKFSNHRNEQ
jgi:hypothetical protein